jgi:hypothetical protein
VAQTPIASQPFGVEDLGEMAINDLGSGTAADATNGNSTPNNGSLVLLVLGTAADTLTITRPEESSADAASVTVVANHLMTFGPFEVDLYGPTLGYKAGATTTKVWPVQVEMLS